MENKHISNNKLENGRIYKITDIGYNECYIGSTVQPLSRRLANHRAKYTLYNKGQHHNVSVFRLFDKYSVENCKIELVEHYPCKDKEELQKREGYWIENTDCVNKCVAGRTRHEWHTSHRKDKQEYDQIRYAKVKAVFFGKTDLSSLWLYLYSMA